MCLKIFFSEKKNIFLNCYYPLGNSNGLCVEHLDLAKINDTINNNTLNVQIRFFLENFVFYMKRLGFRGVLLRVF